MARLFTKKQLSDALEGAGSSFEEFKREVDAQDKVIKYDSIGIVNNLLFWDKLSQGFAYWNKIDEHVYKTLKKLNTLIPYEDWSIEYDLEKNWDIGCQHIDKKSRRLLFKVLAEDLGYEIED